VSEIAENVRRVYERIAEAAAASGRRPEDISLVAATKMNDAARVREAIEAGIKIAGENRVQELLQKDELGAYEGAQLHFIGTLQKNKVKYVVGRCDLIQSVSSETLLREISKRALALGKTQDILLEVNIGDEAAKTGAHLSALEGLLQAAGEEKGVAVCGLMTIPPVCDAPAEARRYFDKMYELFVDIRAKKYDNVTMRILSMGMSGDYAEAILSGADMVRVGTAIFGARHY